MMNCKRKGRQKNFKLIEILININQYISLHYNLTMILSHIHKSFVRFSAVRLSQDKSFISNVQQCNTLSKVMALYQQYQQTFMPRTYALTSRKIANFINISTQSQSTYQILFHYMSNLIKVDPYFLTPLEKLAIIYSLRKNQNFFQNNMPQKFNDNVQFYQKMMRSIYEDIGLLSFNNLVDVLFELARFEESHQPILQTTPIHKLLLQKFPSQQERKESAYHYFILYHLLIQKQMTAHTIQLLKTLTCSYLSLADILPLHVNIRIVELITQKVDTLLEKIPEIVTVAHKIIRLLIQEIQKTKFQEWEEIVSELKEIKQSIEMKSKEIKTILLQISIVTNKLKKIESLK